MNVARANTAEQGRRRLVLSILLLLLLAAISAAAWYFASRMTAPLVSSQGVDTEGYRYLKSVYGDGPDRLHRPTEVAVSSSGDIYAADSFKHRVVVFDSEGAFREVIGGPAKVEGELNYPGAIDVDGRGRVYVTSKEPGKVVIYSPQGEVLRQIPVEDPLTLAVTRERLYVATPKGILLGDLDGNQVGQLSGFGKEAGMIDRPTGMVVDESGTIYLADSLNYRFQAIDAKGKSLWTLGGPPDPKTAVTDRARKYGLPSGIALGSDGLLYGIDAFNGQLVVLTKDGEQIGEFGEWGRQDGQFYYPSSLAEVSSEVFVVADTFNDRLQFVGIPSPRPTVAVGIRRGLPWIAAAAALLAIAALVRRPVSVVIGPAGLRRAESLATLRELPDLARVLYVPEGTSEECRGLIESDEHLASVLREVELGETTEGRDPSVEVALRLRGRLGLRRVAIALPDPETAEEARRLGIGVLDDRVPAGASPQPA